MASKHPFTALINKPLSAGLTLLCFALGLSNSASAGTVEPTSVKSSHTVTTAVLGAYGGLEKIKQINETPFRGTGTMAVVSRISGASNAFDYQSIAKGNRLRLEMTVLGQTAIMGFDGKRSWTQFGDWVCAGSNTATKRLSDEIEHSLAALAQLDNTATKVEVLPSKIVRGKLCDVFKLTDSSGVATTFYADPVSHLILRSEYPGQDPELGSAAVQGSEYSDYRAVEGTQMPFKCVHFSGTHKSGDTIYKTLEADRSVNDSTFAMPPESEIARLKEGPVTIPFEYVGNEILIKVRLNNQHEARFIVDTGASQSVIDKQTAHLLGPYTVSTMSVTTGSKPLPLNYTKIPSLRIGDIELNQIPTLITDLSSFKAALGERPSGLIGANILRRFLVTIDYDEKKIVLADPNNVTVPEGAVIVPTQPVFGATALIVNGKIDGKTPLNFLVDTGAAFNNLPLSLAKPFYNGKVLPVGQIHGLDGQKIEIGSIKLKTLKIGSADINAPVFAMTPDTAPKEHAGLFTHAAMGILGNPFWSQFKLTIDYKNERLILQAEPGREKHQQIVQSLERIDREYLNNKDADKAIKDYQRVQNTAKAAGQKAAEALAMARVASCFADKYAVARDVKWVEQASGEYDKAVKLAIEARNRSVEGQILAQWALLFLNAPRSQVDIETAQNLVKKALQKAPMEGSIYAALGTTMVKAGKTEYAQKLLDQAIMLDPDNWQALWAKYKLCGSLGQTQQQSLVLRQLERYYPGLPDVVSVSKIRSH